MTGTLINAAAVIAGSLAGLLIHSRFPQRIKETVFTAIGLFTLFLGIAMAMKTQNYLILVFSLILGGLSGELMRLDVLLERFAGSLKNRFASGESKFSEGLITAFLLFCMGSMTILGAIEEGLGGKPNLLLAKAMLDGFSSIALASAFGIGVLFSVIPLLIFQGGITLFAAYLEHQITPLMISEMTAVGGIMLIGMGLSILEIKNFRVINLLPGLLFALAIAALMPVFQA